MKIRLVRLRPYRSLIFHSADGRNIVQAVSSWPFTTDAQPESQDSPRDVCSGKGTIFVRKLGFYLPVTFDEYKILVHHPRLVYWVQ